MTIFAVGIGPDHACINSERFAADQPCRHARRDRRLEQLAKDVAVAEAPVPILREGRVIGHSPVKAEATEPAIRKVQMDLVTQPPFRTDAHHIAHDQHPQHQLRIDRGSACIAVKGLQPLANIAEFNEPVNRPQHVVTRNMPLETEAVKQRFLRSGPLTHHRADPPDVSESDCRQQCKSEFFNSILALPAAHQCN
jgi:hypothetical protein